ncbi:MAG TPA: M50 family metallopeptidase [Candidatus Elarobacter sp.]|nr:M50 family metallopeptidase [Candidatus Elarobacter sp.]
MHVSWLAVYAFITFALSRGLGMLPQPEAYALAAVCALALFASVVAHELAHALVARRYGVRTDAITLFLFGGVATLEREPGSPRADALIALAGPLLSALLAAVALALVFAADWFLAHGPVRDAFNALGTYVVVANAVLAVFNLAPAYPMDGGRVLRAVLWRRLHDREAATRIASRAGMVFALLIVAAGVLLAMAVHDLVYLWYVVLGAFLLRQGWSQERAAAASDRRRNADIPAAA